MAVDRKLPAIGKQQHHLQLPGLPDEEGFTASGALRLGVSEMTRFGMQTEDFEALAA